MARGEPQINLRVPETLKAALDAAVASGGRSLNAEVVYRLEQSFAVADRDTHAADALATIIERLGEIERQMGLLDGASVTPRKSTKRDEARARAKKAGSREKSG